jgi:hypothetical protein
MRAGDDLEGDLRLLLGGAPPPQHLLSSARRLDGLAANSQEKQSIRYLAALSATASEPLSRLRTACLDTWHLGSGIADADSLIRPSPSSFALRSS